MSFPKNAVCVIGLSKTDSRNPITYVHQMLIGSFVADPVTGEIYEVEFNTICGVTNRFLAEQIRGSSLFADVDLMCDRINRNYLGSSCKAVQVIIKDAAYKFKERYAADSRK